MLSKDNIQLAMSSTCIKRQNHKGETTKQNGSESTALFPAEVCKSSEEMALELLC